MVFPNIFLLPRLHGFTPGVGVCWGELIGLNRPQFNIHFVPDREKESEKEREKRGEERRDAP